MLGHVLQHFGQCTLQDVSQTRGIDQSAQRTAWMIVHLDGHHGVRRRLHGSETEIDFASRSFAIRIHNDSPATMLIIFGGEAVAHGSFPSGCLNAQFVLTFAAANGCKGTLQDDVVVTGVTDPVENVFSTHTGEENVLGNDRHVWKSNMVWTGLVRSSNARVSSLF